MYRYNHHSHVDINQFISCCNDVPKVLPSAALAADSNTLVASNKFATEQNWTKIR